MKKYIVGLIFGLIMGLAGAAYAHSYEVNYWTDPDTKVQYLVVREYWDGVAIGICPRYTSNGNIMYVGSEIVEGD